MTPPLPRRLVAESLGSFLLFATVVGSGIMGEALAGGNDAVALLGNTAATGAMLFVLITMLGPISGAHMNPAVSIVAAIRGDLPARDAAAYSLVQLGAGILGVWCVHLMFELPIVQFSVKARSGIGQAASEALATFGLILTILGTVRHRRSLLVHLVDQFRQPRDHRRAKPQQQFRRNFPGGRPAVRRGTVGGGGTGRAGRPLSVRRRRA
jgi:glycerol uptake facilitator-like aquaporin